MKIITILIPESSVIQSIADPHYLFSTINRHFIAEGKPPAFEIHLAGLNSTVHQSEGLFSVHPEKLLKDINKTDLIIIPALFGDMQNALKLNEKMLPWIIEQHQKGAEVASLCVGAFLLAATGLLNGKSCSTHWSFSNLLRKMYPNIEVVDGKIITEEQRIYSSGGAHSYWNLLLHLVEKYTDRETAVLISKFFAIDIDRQSQSAFAMFKGQKDHSDEAVKKAQEFIEHNVENKISVDDLANKVSVGRRSFERRFKQATKNSVLEYIQRVRIESAKRRFENSRKNINEVMFDVGYTDTKAFRTVFKKITGLTPLAYRNKYLKVEHE